MDSMAPLAEHADDRGDDRLREARDLDQLAEDRAEQEHREIQLQEADHLVHEQAGEHRRDQAAGSVSSTAPSAATGANRITL
jgi:hypothetical protein